MYSFPHQCLCFCTRQLGIFGLPFLLRYHSLSLVTHPNLDVDIPNEMLAYGSMSSTAPPLSVLVSPQETFYREIGAIMYSSVLLASRV
jgi:hypothetical protein